MYLGGHASLSTLSLLSLCAEGAVDQAGKIIEQRKRCASICLVLRVRPRQKGDESGVSDSCKHGTPPPTLRPVSAREEGLERRGLPHREPTNLTMLFLSFPFLFLCACLPCPSACLLVYLPLTFPLGASAADHPPAILRNDEHGDYDHDNDNDTGTGNG